MTATLEASLRAIDAHYQAMPPVAGMGVRIVACDGDSLRLHAPLALHVNDKDCAFGGSLASVMTLACWGLVSLRVREAGLDADVFVADSTVRYLAPLYADLVAEARLSADDSWDVFLATLRARGRARAVLEAQVPLPDGGTATTLGARFVAILRR